MLGEYIVDIEHENATIMLLSLEKVMIKKTNKKRSEIHSKSIVKEKFKNICFFNIYPRSVLNPSLASAACVFIDIFSGK